MLLRRLGRVVRGRVEEKKGSRFPTLRTHTSTCTPRGKKDEASVKKRRVGVVALVGEGCESSRPRKGERKGCRKECRVAYARDSARKTDGGEKDRRRSERGGERRWQRREE